MLTCFRFKCISCDAKSVRRDWVGYTVIDRSNKGPSVWSVLGVYVLTSKYELCQYEYTGR